MLKIYPQLADTRIDYAWGGTLAITMNRMPCFARPHPNVLSASGYSGHGVALATLAGKILAEAVTGQAEGFDLMASIPAAALSRRGGAALAASGAGDDLVFRCATGWGFSRALILPAQVDRAEITDA